MSAHLTFKELPKINSCKECQGSGIIQYYNLDGGPYYSWMKPETKECKLCRGKPDE